MERARHSMEEVIQKQKRMLEQSRADMESRPAKDRSQYVLAIGGVAAGLTIAVIVWLAKAIVTTDHLDMSTSGGTVAVQRGEIRKLAGSIAQLNARMKSLTGTVYTLEDKLVHLMEQTGSIATSEAQHASSSLQPIPESAATRAIQIPTDAETAFDPTYIVKARINLRPAASLNTTPLTVLDVGTKVEYIGKSDGWYYVKTRSRGNGWCSSDYLSPLSSTQPNSSAR